MTFLSNKIPIRQWNRSRLSISIVLLLAGCTVGPHYRRPSVVDESLTWKNRPVKNTDTSFLYSKSDSSFNTLSYDTGDSIQKIENNWWLLFGDDTLNQLIEEAFANNPSLKTAAFRIMESRGMVQTAKANFYPVLTIDPNMNRTQLAGDRPSQFSSSRLPELRINTINVPLDMSYEVDVWGKFRKSVDAAQANMRASQADYQVVRLGLVSDIATNYFNLRLTDSQIQLYINALKLRRDNLVLTQSQYKSGITTQLDVIQAEIEVTTVESQIIDARQNRAIIENALAVLCGIPVMSFNIQARTGLPRVPIIPLEVPADLLQRRPDIVEAEQQLIYANAQVGIAQAAFLPTLKLSAASAGFLSSRFDNLFSSNSITWIGGVGVSIPVFTGGRNIAQKSIAENQLKETQSMYKQVVLNAFREVEDAMVNLQYRSEQAAVQRKALSLAQASAGMSKELYRTGLTTYINVIAADRAVLDAENAYITITGQRLLYSITLIKALGGGWNGTK